MSTYNPMRAGAGAGAGAGVLGGGAGPATAAGHAADLARAAAGCAAAGCSLSKEKWRPLVPLYARTVVPRTVVRS